MHITNIQATEVSVGFDSQYVTEGREQLSSGGIAWLSATQALNETISVSLTYGYATDSKADYDELDLTVEYASSLSGFDYAIALTRLEFLKDNTYDNEAAISLSYTGNDLLSPFVNVIYGQQANGFFLNLGVTTEIELTTNLSMSPQALVAYDYGYAQGLRDGYSHTAIRSDFTYAVNEDLAITGIIEKTFAGSILQEETNDADQLWAGIHLVFNW